MHVNDLLKIAVERGASDLHLKAGSYPMMRVRGELTPVAQDRRIDHDEMICRLAKPAHSSSMLPTRQIGFDAARLAKVCRNKLRQTLPKIEAGEMLE